MLPGWQRALAPYIEAGKIVAVGIVQEQHPDRARLYRQWRQLDWPILVDSLNLLDLRVVPIPYALDESGIVRLSPRGMTPEKVAAFIEEEFPAVKVPEGAGAAPKSPTAAEVAYLEGRKGSLEKLIASYRQALRRDPRDARAHFRLGVALRARHESEARQPGDAQAAVASWTEALARNPNQYIWRRRIQQYGPRLDKPYNFYFWVEQARREIRARGDQPVPLGAEPRGSEIAARADSGEGAAAAPIPDPDPSAEIQHDEKKSVLIETVVTPPRVRPGGPVRVRVRFEPKHGLWNNESEPLTLSPRLPASLPLSEGEFVHANPTAAETDEVRYLEFELRVEGKKEGRQAFPAYALYNVCDKKGGVCRFLRQDFEVAVMVDLEAPILDDRAFRSQRRQR